MRATILIVLLTAITVVMLRIVDGFYGESTSPVELVALILGGILLALYFRAKDRSHGGGGGNGEN